MMRIMALINLRRKINKQINSRIKLNNKTLLLKNSKKKMKRMKKLKTKTKIMENQISKMIRMLLK